MKNSFSKKYTLEEIRAFISRCNLIDDEFFKIVANDKAFCEELLHIILNRTDITVESYNTQVHLPNLNKKSVILDLVCKDSNNTTFNVEVQKSNNDDMQRRMRYNTASIDVKNLFPGKLYKELPDVYSIMICDFDIFKEEKTVYYIDRVLRVNSRMQDNGIHELYLYTGGKDKTPVTELMQYMLNSTGYNEKFPAISKRVQLCKEQNLKEDQVMSVFDEIREEGKEEGKEEGINIVASRMKAMGISISEISKATELTQEQINAL